MAPSSPTKTSYGQQPRLNDTEMEESPEAILVGSCVVEKRHVQKEHEITWLVVRVLIIQHLLW